MRIGARIAYGAVGGLLFAVFMESFNSLYVAAGFLVFFFLGGRFGTFQVKRSPAVLFRYFAGMPFKILISALRVLKTVAAEPNPEYHVIVPEADGRLSEGERLIVSNSITLTPGTVTLDIGENAYTVLELGKGGGNPAAEFEAMLEGER